MLTKYHGFGKPNSKVVQIEYAEYVGAIATDGADSRWWDFLPIFQGKGAIYRTAYVINLGILYRHMVWQLSRYLLPSCDAGIKNVHISLLVTCITSTVALFLAL